MKFNLSGHFRGYVTKFNLSSVFRRYIVPVWILAFTATCGLVSRARSRLTHKPLHNDVARLDVVGNDIKPDKEKFLYTVNPDSGDFELLVVQAQEECEEAAVTWEQKPLTIGTPRVFRAAFWHYKGIPMDRRWDQKSYRWYDWLSIACRWVPAGVALAAVLPLAYFSKPRPAYKDPYAYVELRCKWYFYPRLARNISENRPAVRRRLEQNGRHEPFGGPCQSYRAFRPTRLCFVTKNNDRSVANQQNEFWYVTKDVTKDDTPNYVFISYSFSQFEVQDDSKRKENVELLYASAAKITHALGYEAFWLANECQRQLDPNLDAEKKKELIDEDVYTMSDVIRQSSTTVIITTSDSQERGDQALKDWGSRVWTIPEILLSQDSLVTWIHVASMADSNTTNEASVNSRKDLRKLDLAQRAWHDASEARQLLEHFTSLHLSRLELSSIALQCLQRRVLKQKHPGDRSYALMGLLRLRPPIDSEDSAFQAFARLSLAQDSDRLLERLIFLLPESPLHPWESMSDVYSSKLWDIEPSCQVCGVGENDTVILDGLRGGLIQWSQFNSVFRDQPWKAFTVRIFNIVMIILFLVIFILQMGVVTGKSPLPQPHPRRDSDGSNQSSLALYLAYILAPVVALVVIIIAIIPAVGPLLLGRGQEHSVEPYLFGFEGYMPLDQIEERLFGSYGNRLQWSAHGSAHSRHVQGTKRQEPLVSYLESRSSGTVLKLEDEDDLDTSLNPIWTYAMEPVDPLSQCEDCIDNKKGGVSNGGKCSHETHESALKKAKADYGSLKLFTLVDTGSMEVTLFESVRPPVALFTGASEGGMRRALACSLDINTGTFYRETVLRVPGTTEDKMRSVPRIRLGLNCPQDWLHK